MPVCELPMCILSFKDLVRASLRKDGIRSKIGEVKSGAVVILFFVHAYVYYIKSSLKYAYEGLFRVNVISALRVCSCSNLKSNGVPF